jgi:hypothetical protein
VESGRVPGCGRRGEAHRGNGHGGAPTAAGNRARNGGVYGGGALACAQRGGGGRGRAGWCANEGGGEQGSGLKWLRARWGESHARRGRGDRGTHGGGYAKTEKLTSQARGAEREKKAGAGAREAGLTGRAHGQRERARERARARGSGSADRWGRVSRERRGERRARGGPTGPKGRGGGGEVGCFAFFFCSELFSPFLLFILFD